MKSAFNRLFILTLILLPDLVKPQTFAEQDKIAALDRGSGDMFGYSVSISGNYAIVGAQHESEDTNGLNTLFSAGAAYIFEKSPAGNWIQAQKLVPSDRTTNDYFGASVSIDGNVAVVGAYEKDSLGGTTFLHAGAVYVFERDVMGIWHQVKKLVASDPGAHDHFGFSVRISGDYIIAGCPIDAEDASGNNPLASAGSAYIYERVSGVWTFKQKLAAADRDAVDLFGYSVSVYGNVAIVGSYREDEDALGGNTISDAGSAYIFERNGAGNWLQVQKIVAADRANTDRFGIAVSVSGNYALVGAYLEDEDALGANTLNGAGSAYMFERNGAGVWNQVQKLVAPDRAANDNFGTTLCIHGNYAIVGVPFEDEDENGVNTIPAAGSAYIYQKDGGGIWNMFSKIVASDRASSDYFGFSVSINGNQVISSAYLEDEDALGGNSMSGAGSAYVFEYCTHTAHSFSVNTCAQYVSPSGNYTWTTSGIYSDTIVNAGGCDSVLTINLIIQNTDSTLTHTSCLNYVSPSGNYTWTTSGTYMDTVTNAAGCDSVLTIYLTVLASYATINENVCASYISPSGNYTWTATGTYYDTLTNMAGCDSVITVNLTVNNSYGSISESSCGIYVSPSGNTYTTSGVYTDTISNMAGCDSIITINLTIITIDTTVNQTGFTLISVISGAVYQWLDCGNGNSVIAGEVNQTFSPAVDGNYAVSITQAGCVDTSFCHEVIGIGITNISANMQGYVIYPNPSSGNVTFRQATTMQPFFYEVYDVTGRKILSGQTSSSATVNIQVSGMYLVRIKTGGTVIESKLVVE